VSLASKKQPSAAASTMDAEYQACGAVALEGLSLVKALHELEPLSTTVPLKDPIVICCDDRAALSLCRDHKEGQRMKHVDVIHHFSRDHVESGALKFVYCNSCYNLGSILVKSCPFFNKRQPSFHVATAFKHHTHVVLGSIKA
jgi:hypothetical protein